jgi:hypothetical protein
MMRVATNPEAVAKYTAALAEVERLAKLPESERDEEAYRTAILATRDAFTAIANSNDL